MLTFSKFAVLLRSPEEVPTRVNFTRCPPRNHADERLVWREIHSRCVFSYLTFCSCTIVSVNVFQAGTARSSAW